MIRPTFIILIMLLVFSVTSNSIADDARLTGHWQGHLGDQIVSLEIVSNNRLMFDGVPVYYRQFPGILRMWGDYGPIDYPYSFENEVLVITFPEGYQFLFSREGDSATSGKEHIAAWKSGNQDAQLQRLLLSSSWCAFSLADRFERPKQVLRKKRLTKIRFNPDGIFRQSFHSGSYSSGAGGVAMRQLGTTRSGYWKLQQGVLFISNSGELMKPVLLDITFDSAGFPILYYAGNEYIRCN